jgi:hypothetical protein
MIRGTCTMPFGFAIAALIATGAVAQTPDGARDRSQLPQPVYKVAQNLAAAGNAQAPAPVAPNQGQTPAAPAAHPLEPALKIAYASLATIHSDIKDYSATMVKRERIGGTLHENEFMYIKVRHQPFSVYMYFLAPASLKGQEALFVAGKNDDKLIGHGVGVRKILGTVHLDPTGAVAMSGQRYPITELGIENLTKRLIQVAENDKKFGECEVKFFQGAKINGRVCTCIQVTHPVARKNFLFNVARVFVDNQMNVPVRYEAYEWPVTPGGQPQLLEEYTYLNMKLNNGFTDADFDENNTEYKFH